MCLIFLFCFVTSQLLIAQTQPKATFHHFQYEGKDVCFNQPLQAKTQYFNPIVAGFYPDPSICRKGNDYYLVHSTFSYYPGIPIWHSTDLVNWKQIGHVLNRPSQLKLNNLELSAGIFAPTIRYNEKNNTFYLICTVVGGINNFIVKTNDLKKGWSDPILLPDVNGIDPSIFFDDNGKTYIVNCGVPIVSKWRGHRAVWLTEYNTQTDQVVGGAGKIIVDGGVDTSKHPLWLEGPHLYKVNNKYLLMAAEGGTSEGHSEVIFESEQVGGPYKPCHINPILTQRNLDPNRTNAITSTGHADLIKTPKGDWWAVFLATRPYQKHFYSTGRETFLLPVTWKNNVPIILDSALAIPVVNTKSSLNKQVARPTGNFLWKDDFTKPQLQQEWLMLRTPNDTPWYSLQNGTLQLEALPKSIFTKTNPAYLGRRQQHTSFSASTQFDFEPQNAQHLAGMVLFQNDKNNLIIGKTIKDNQIKLLVFRSKLGVNSILNEIVINPEDAHKPIQIYMDVVANLCQIQYAFAGSKTRLPIATNINIQYLSTHEAGGFVGATIGMYATAAFSSN